MVTEAEVLDKKRAYREAADVFKVATKVRNMAVGDDCEKAYLAHAAAHYVRAEARATYFATAKELYNLTPNSEATMFDTDTLENW